MQIQPPNKCYDNNTIRHHNSPKNTTYLPTNGRSNKCMYSVHSPARLL